MKISTIEGLRIACGAPRIEFDPYDGNSLWIRVPRAYVEAAQTLADDNFASVLWPRVTAIEDDDPTAAALRHFIRGLS